MLDIKLIRENPDLVKENIKKKFQDQKLPLVDEVLELDKENRAVMAEAQELRSARNSLSKQVGILMGQSKKDPSKLAEAEEAKAKVKANADRLAELEAKETELAQKIRKIMLQIPNIIDPSVPIGPDDSCNVEVQRFGEPVVPDFEIPTTPRSWSPSTALTWTPPAGCPATASTTSWATSPASTRACWPTPGTL